MKKIGVFSLLVGSILAASCGAAPAEPTQAPAQQPVEEGEREAEQVPTPAEQPAGEQAAEPAQTPDPDVVLATGADDIVGMWTRTLEGSATSFYFKEDGTYNLDLSTDVDRLVNSPGLVGEYWFEGSQLNLRDVEQIRGVAVGMCPGVGVYEVILLDNGNIRFQPVEDECAGRVDNMAGPGFIDIEYMPLQ